MWRPLTCKSGDIGVIEGVGLGNDRGCDPGDVECRSPAVAVATVLLSFHCPLLWLIDVRLMEGDDSGYVLLPEPWSCAGRARKVAEEVEGEEEGGWKGGIA